MLKNFFTKFYFHRFCQSGFYFDFFYKKVSEVFTRNVFIFTSQFFAEKYMIEVFTKKIIDSSIYFTNKFIGWNNLNYFNFFFQIICIFFYFMGFINLICIF